MGALYDFEGKTYKISPWTFGIQGEFELYLEECERRESMRWRPLLSPDEFSALLTKVNGDLAAGKYAFGGDEFRKATMTTRHYPHLLLLCLKPEHPEATLDLARKMVNQDLETLMQKMQAANQDPNQTSSAQGPEQ